MIVDKARFGEMFKDALVAANNLAAHKPNALLDQIELQYRGAQECSFAEATEKLFINESSFYRVIDVAVHPRRVGWFFVCPSSHVPEGWERTRFPTTTGPFNVMVPA